MAQTTSYEIDNESGAVVRGRLNDVFAAIQSSNSGPTPPADTAPGMLWLDTSGSPSVLFRRNAADSDWVPVAPEIASQAEAEAGTNNTKLMTPLRTAQAIDELIPPVAQLTQLQAEDPASTVFGTVSGELLAAAIAEAGLPEPDFTDEVGPNFPSAGSTTVFTHGLGGIPKLVQIYAVCTTATRGYSVGDKIPMHTNYSSTNQGSNYQVDNLAIRFLIGTSNTYIFGRDNNVFLTLTTTEAANFKLRVEAWA